MKKIVFFDADQTILDMRKGIPESAKTAIRQLTENGQEAFLCTGRSYSFVLDEVRAMAFTGMIAGGGGYLQHRGEVLLDVKMPQTLAERAVRIIRECGMVSVMEGTDYMYFDPDEYGRAMKERAILMQQQLGSRWKPLTGNEKNLQISKFSVKAFPDSNIERACKELGGELDYVIHETDRNGMTTLEFMMKGYTKGTAVKRACELLHIPQENSICFGDSNNDITMFDACHYGVAMGNSSPEILRRADLVTDSLFEDGVQHALQKLQLI